MLPSGTDCGLLQAGSNDRHIWNNKGKKRWVMTAWKGDSISFYFLAIRVGFARNWLDFSMWSICSLSPRTVCTNIIGHTQIPCTGQIILKQERLLYNLAVRLNWLGSYELENLFKIVIWCWMFVALFKKRFTYWVINSVFGLAISVLRNTLRNIFVDEAAVGTGMNEAWLQDKNRIIWWLTLATIIFSEWSLEAGFYCPTHQQVIKGLAIVRAFVCGVLCRIIIRLTTRVGGHTVVMRANQALLGEAFKVKIICAAFTQLIHSSKMVERRF